jgi:hypothetical protein
MTRNRKADLQRKLTMAPVATPPAGLADRIKSDIPHLGFESERTNLRKSAMFNLRIAASIVLLASSLYLALHLLSRTGLNTQPAAMMKDRTVAPAPRMAEALPNTPPEPGTARVQQRADLPSLPSGPPPASIAAVPPHARFAEARHTEAVGMSAGQPAYVDTVEETAPKAERIIVANAAPAAPSVAAPQQVEPQPAPTPMMDFDSAGAAADRSVAKAATSPRERLNRDEAPVRNFVAIQQAIARGETPRNIDIGAIVQHFAAPERAPADLRVELEASATPLDATKWLLRVSVDAPAATATAIDLAFGDAVSSHHALAGSPAANTTALYEIEFKPNARPDQAIATARAGNVERTIRVADLHPWNTASSRMKRASLAAAWARTLQSRTQADAIVAKAREAHIDELVDMAESAARIR